MDESVPMDILWEGVEYLALVRAMKLDVDIFPWFPWLVVDGAFEEVSR